MTGVRRFGTTKFARGVRLFGTIKFVTGVRKIVVGSNILVLLFMTRIAEDHVVNITVKKIKLSSHFRRRRKHKIPYKPCKTETEHKRTEGFVFFCSVTVLQGLYRFRASVSIYVYVSVASVNQIVGVNKFVTVIVLVK